MSERQYLLFLDVDARKRHYHVAERGRIIRFVVQLEIRVAGGWKEVVRYDCAHDYTHKDSYNMEGRRHKMRLFLSYEDALSLADDDITENWEVYRDRFLRGVFP
jgi:hypothetical protein